MLDLIQFKHDFFSSASVLKVIRERSDFWREKNNDVRKHWLVWKVSVFLYNADVKRHPLSRC